MIGTAPTPTVQSRKGKGRRKRREVEPWAVTVGGRHAREDEMERLNDALAIYRERPDDRPRTRAQCPSSGKPCPWVLCRYHLWLDRKQYKGRDALNMVWPDRAPEALDETCALHAAERHSGEGMSLQEVSDLIDTSRERVRQLEAEAMQALKVAMGESGLDGVALGGFPSSKMDV